LKIGLHLHTHDPAEWGRIQPREARTAYIEQIREQTASVPQVSTVAVGIDATPPAADLPRPFLVGGSGDGSNSNEPPQARVMLVGPQYFAVLRIPLLEGRVWSADENFRGDFVAVVNQVFAMRYLSSSDAPGLSKPMSNARGSNTSGSNITTRQLRIPDLTPRNHYQVASSQSTAWRQIIGVVGDARNNGVDGPVVPAIYIPYTALMQPWVDLLVRTQGDPLTCLQSIRAAIASVASDQQIANGISAFDGTFTLTEAIERDAQYSRQRLFSILFGIFSAIALALALVGIFSVVAYRVAQRTTEFGLRLALGAPRAQVLWVAARIALVSAAAGIVAGLVFDCFLGAVLAHWMQNAFAAGSLFAAAALLALSALLACLLPARYAIAVPPAEALRYE
jgi:hypothetical protein